MDLVIKRNEHYFSLESEDIRCVIEANKVSDLEPYLHFMYHQAKSVWDYSKVESWDTPTHYLAQGSGLYYKVHQLGVTEMLEVFCGGCFNSPKPLTEVDNRNIFAYVYLSLTEAEYDEIKAQIKEKKGKELEKERRAWIKKITDLGLIGSLPEAYLEELFKPKSPPENSKKED